MFGFLGFILIFILFIVLIVVALLGNLVRAIFGLGRRAPKNYYGDKTSSQTGQSYSSTQSSQTTVNASGKKKIFTEDEGEYVEFEEVK